MNRTELTKYLRKSCESMIEIAEAKGHDYSGDANPFANLEACELLDLASTETGILVRILDKFMRIKNFVHTGVLKVADEKIEDTCKDAANYFLLLAAKINARRTKNSELESEVDDVLTNADFEEAPRAQAPQASQRRQRPRAS